jgi:hypothetical protein
MSTVFADASYFFAFLNSKDELYARARAFTEGFDGRMLTTAWVLTEVADGMADPMDRPAFIAFLEGLRIDPQVRIVPATEALWDAGIARYAARPDKDWSLTDCISFVVMEREGLSDALTGDRHFAQAGFNVLLK